MQPTNLTSSIQVSEEMIEAGVAELTRIDRKGRFVGSIYRQQVEAIYLAMRSKDHSIAGDDVRERAIKRVVHELRLSESVFRDYSQQHRDKAEAADPKSREHSERMRKSLRNFERAAACMAALDDFDAAITAIGSEGERE